MVGHVAPSVMIIRAALLLLLCLVGCRAQPPPKLVAPLVTLSAKENSEIGLWLKTISFTDNQGQMQGKVTKVVSVDPEEELLEKVIAFSPGPTEAQLNITVASLLDRETIAKYKIFWAYKDVRDDYGWIEPTNILFTVEDVNDNPPEWHDLPPDNKVEVEETIAPDTLVFDAYATDPDLGFGGQVVYSLADKTLAEGYFEGRTTRPDNVLYPNGIFEVYVMKPLDYQEKAIHEVLIVATDGGGDPDYEPILSTTLPIYVNVLDVPNKPPLFIKVPYNVYMEEHLDVDSQVLIVEAVDQDTGSPLPLLYSLVESTPDPDLVNKFAIDESTGVMTIAEEVDRELLLDINGRFEVKVEVRKDTDVDEWKANATALVYVNVLDINDNEPEFAMDSYTGSILENSPKSVPVTIDQGDIQVYDWDSLDNGTLAITLDGDDGVFSVQPEIVVNEGTILLRVLDPTKLDYQLMQSISFQLVATESKTPEGYSGRTNVIVHLIDTNDKFPQWVDAPYYVELYENASITDHVIQLLATDADSGDYGIVYYYILDTGIDRFVVEETTGLVSVDQPLDRETTDKYYLSVEARDYKGQGNRNSTTLEVVILDVNDNAPVFEYPSYDGYIEEDDFNPPPFRLEFIVHATDADLPPNSDISYFFIDDDYSLVVDGNFIVDEFTGVITARTPIDFESMDPDTQGATSPWYRSFSLVAMAIDHGEPPLNSTVPVMIYVEDVNDNSPIFNPDAYEVVVDETVAAGTSITHVSATDADPTPYNGAVSYRLDGVGIDKFAIDATSGEVTVAPNAKLDLTLTGMKQYSLTVLASDDGVPRLSGSADLTIDVTDVNDKPPVFDATTYDGSIYEESVLLTSVIQTMASDPDETALLRYRVSAYIEGRDEFNAIVSEDVFDDWFDIDDNGMVRVNSSYVDREKVETLKMTIEVEDVNADPAFPDQKATASVFITILDINDNAPSFLFTSEDDDHYAIDVQENVLIETLLMTIRATDPDKGENGTVEFMLLDDSDSPSKLKIDQQTGELRTAAEIDYDCGPPCHYINVTVIAYDLGINTLSTPAPIVVSVGDMNDNRPVIHNLPFGEPIWIYENATEGLEVFVVDATDIDSGDYGLIGYFVDKLSLEKFNFTDVESGRLEVNGELDRETVPSYVVHIEVRDNYKSVFGPSLTATESLEVKLLDVNDNAPVFTLPAGPFDIKQTHQVGTLVGQVLATDADEPGHPNSEVFYFLADGIGTGDGYFAIENEDVGAITTKAEVQDLYGEYDIVVVAQDRGEPPLSSNINVVIDVLDVNLHSPVWEHPPTPEDNEQIRLPESSRRDTWVALTWAKDVLDHGENAEVSYKFDGAPDSEYFRVSAHANGTATIFVERTLLPYAEQKEYKLVLIAYDCAGCEISLDNTTRITVYAYSLTAPDPEFDRTQEEEVFSRLEHEEPFKYKLGEIPAAFYDDPEVDDKICYCIVDGDENDRFSVSGNKDDDKFQLWQDKELDREEKASYELVVQATNCDKEPDYDESLINATAYLPVRVVVGDINDSPVAFMQTLYTAGITTDNQLGDVVLDTIKATTLDIYPNDVMTYAIVKDSWNYDELDHNYDEPSDPFKIDAVTAVITLAHNPGDDSSGYIKFKVIVTDPPVDEGPHSSTADVTIQILSQNDQMEFVLAMSKSEFYDKRDEFVKTLEDITGLTAYVDEVATYYDESGAASESLISVFVHFVDEDGDIVGVGAVEDLFDRADTDDVVVLYEEFSVYSIQGRGRREAKPVAAVGRAYILALIIVSIILPIVIVVLVCVWCNEVKKYKRKLRAAKAVAFGEEAISSRESEMNKITVPNTNQYAYEGSNPMWMQTVDANVFDNAAMKDDDEESDTTSQNSLDLNNVGAVPLSKSGYAKSPIDGGNYPGLADNGDLTLRNNLNNVFNEVENQYEDLDHMERAPGKLPTSYL